MSAASPDEVETERRRVAVEGWGVRLLAAQDVDGQWGHALYSPKWTSTTYTLLLLHWLGLPSGHPQALAGCRQVWDGAQLDDGGWNCETVRCGSWHPAFTRFPFPPQWHFDVLRGLEHFRAAGAVPDDRLADAVALVRRARRADGTWPVYGAYPGRTWFRMEPSGPSRWATPRALRVLRVLRVLRWWDHHDDL